MLRSLTSAFRLLGSAALFCCLVFPLYTNANENNDNDNAKIIEHMHKNLDQVAAIKAAVIAGKLEDVREPADWLATHDVPVWLPPVEDLRRYAARAAAAQDLATAAGSTSEIARTCGECHAASGVKVAMGFAEPPSADEQSLVSQMQRHLWAADRMWSGLIGPSDTAWVQGAEILAEVRLAGVGLEGDAVQADMVDALARRVQQIGEQARQADSRELRSDLYGEFLSLCANCHQLSGQGPGAR